MWKKIPGEALLQDCLNYTGPITRKQLRNHSTLIKRGNRLLRSGGLSLKPETMGCSVFAEFSLNSLFLWERHHLVFKAVVVCVVRWDYHRCCMHQPANCFRGRLYSKRNAVCSMYSERFSLLKSWDTQTCNKERRKWRWHCLVCYSKTIELLAEGGPWVKYCSKEFWKASAGVTAIIGAELVAMQSILLLTKGADLPAGARRDGFFIYAERFRLGCIQNCKVSPITSGAELYRRRRTWRAGNSFSIKESKLH